MPDRFFFREDFFTVVECDQCGLGFVNRRPTITEIQKYYPAEYYQNPPTTSHNRYLTKRFTAEAFPEGLGRWTQQTEIAGRGLREWAFSAIHGGAGLGRGGCGDFAVVGENYGLPRIRTGIPGYSGE